MLVLHVLLTLETRFIVVNYQWSLQKDQGFIEEVPKGDSFVFIRTPALVLFEVIG